MKPACPLFLLVFSSLIFADQITIKNGDIFSGNIVTADAKTVILKTTYAGDIKIERTQIAGITTTQVLNVSLKDHERIQGKVTSTWLMHRVTLAAPRLTTQPQPHASRARTR